MKGTITIPSVLFAVAALLLAPALLCASEVRLGGQGGTEDKPDEPSEGAETEENLNPTVICPPPGPPPVIFTFDDLLDCLVDGIENPEEPEDDGGNAPFCLQTPCIPHLDDFTASLLDDGTPDDGPWGVEIRRFDADAPPPPPGFPTVDYELERIEFRENDSSIQTTELRNELSHRVARIRGLSSDPVVPAVPDPERKIIIEIDEVCLDEYGVAHPPRVEVPTWNKSALQINVELTQGLRACGYSVDYRPQCIETDEGMAPCLVVSDTDGIHRVQFRSTDPSIVESDISLLPPDDAELEVATPFL